MRPPGLQHDAGVNELDLALSCELSEPLGFGLIGPYEAASSSTQKS
jgi:hypothetical protein